MTSGVALPQITQSLIYHHFTNGGNIRTVATKRSVNGVKSAAKDILEEIPMDKMVWRSIRHRDVTGKIRDFLWKHTHRIYRLGNFWKHILNGEYRAVCPLCDKRTYICGMYTRGKKGRVGIEPPLNAAEIE